MSACLCLYVCMYVCMCYMLHIFDIFSALDDMPNGIYKISEWLSIPTHCDINEHLHKLNIPKITRNVEKIKYFQYSHGLVSLWKI